MQSRDLYERAKRLLPGGVNSPVRAFEPYPFFIKEGYGSRIRDVDGNEYVDYCLAYGPLILGHKHPKVMKAVEEQLSRGTMYGIPTELELHLAEKVIEHVPCAEMVRFASSGTDAATAAVRLARGITDRECIIMFDGGYHGANDYFLFTSSGPKTSGLPADLGKYTLVAEYNNLSSVEYLLKKHRVAAVVVEPVMGNVGCIPPEIDFLRGLRELCDTHETLLIFDEVITGFRLGMGGAQEYYGVIPDIAIFGKILGGGFPIGAIAGKRELMEQLSPSGKIFHAGTFNGHPIAMAAGLATLEVLEKENIIQSAAKHASHVEKIIARTTNLPINRVASMLQVFFTRKASVKNAQDARTSDRARFMQFHKCLLENGVFVPPSQFECWFTSGAHNSSDLRILEQAIDRAMEVLGMVS
jgi:glutamate-1-semialdehyde 2,1-aminomutase